MSTATRLESSAVARAKLPKADCHHLSDYMFWPHSLKKSPQHLSLGNDADTCSTCFAPVNVMMLSRRKRLLVCLGNHSIESEESLGYEGNVTSFSAKSWPFSVCMRCISIDLRIFRHWQSRIAKGSRKAHLHLIKHILWLLALPATANEHS
jgi:hypothetical protein